MMNFDIHFDSRASKYKEPFGAVPSGTELRFTLGVGRSSDVHRASIVVKYDRHDQPAYYDMWKKNETDDPSIEYYEAKFKIHDRGIYWYYFQLETSEGTVTVGCQEPTHQAAIQRLPNPWQQTVYNRDGVEPEWIYGGVYYQIFVDRFCHAGEYIEPASSDKVLRRDWGGIPEYEPKDGVYWNNDFFGGNLAGIREKLPYLEELGVTCLYLSPIFEAFSNHRYDTGDYLRIDPMVGTEEELHSLCDEAEARGIRVILDGVFAHTGSDSRYFNKDGNYGDGGAWQDSSSPYREWYSIESDGTYDSWWGIDTLPKLNKNCASYRDFICGEDGVARHWLRQGVSGWRLDVVDELPSKFLEALSKAVHEEKSDALIVGEVWEDASNKVAYEERKNYFEGDKLDTVMDYPLKNAILQFVRNGDALSLDRTMMMILENYPPFAVHSLMNFVGTHDSVRAITALAGKELPIDVTTRPLQASTHMDEAERQSGTERLRAASLLQMSLPGVPCIYYGDEAGLEGYADPFNRGCFPWGNEDTELQEWYRQLIRIRRSHKVFEKGSYRTLACDDGVFAFIRRVSEENVPAMITVVHRGNAPQEFGLKGAWKDLLTGEILVHSIRVEPGELRWMEQVIDD